MQRKKFQKNICFYFQVHQPLRLSRLKFFDLEEKKDYFRGTKNHSNEYYIKKVGKKSYYPANNLILKLLKKYPEFKVSYSISGIALEQFEEYDQGLIESFQDLVSTKKVELLSETYYHSLSWIFSKQEFLEQINLHRRKIWDLFKRKPKVFRNTELIYNNELGNFIRNLGYEGILAEGWDYYLGDRSPNYLYSAPNFELPLEDIEFLERHRFFAKVNKSIALLLKNYKLSDDIAFRFSNRAWNEYPLTVEKFVQWVKAADGDTINLFMDYETFGEHQWEDSGIFKFLEKLPAALLEAGIGFKTPTESVRTLQTKEIIDIHELISWADMERDLSAWLGNKMQREAAKQIYGVEKKIKQVVDEIKYHEQKQRILDTWRKLQTSDHFYYMSTKYWNDGDIHKYFSPYESPYDAYINYMNVLSDFEIELEKVARSFA